jgi:hypothetical protein
VTAVAHPDCNAFGCVGLPYCNYCGELIDSVDARTVLVAAGRVRRGDVLGALRLLQGHPMTPRADRASRHHAHLGDPQP